MNDTANTGTSPSPGPTKGKLELGGIVALVAPLAATIGLFKATGTIGRLQRDEPILLMIAVALVLVAGGLLTVASFMYGEDGHSESGQGLVRLLGVGFAVFGFALAVVLVIANARNESRPTITASLDGSESKVSAKVSASNLATDKHLEVKVDLATLKPEETLDDPHPFVPGSSLQLERAYVGPDTDGEAEETISIPIPPGGTYTDIVIKAFTAAQGGCAEPSTVSGNAGTACMFLTLDPERGTG